MPAVKKIGSYSIQFFRVTQHLIVHIVIGVIYAWVLRNFWQDLSNRYIVLAALGSLLIDLDHLAYFFTYGRREWYAIEARKLMHRGQLKNLANFLKNGHKHNTGLATHNVYYLAFFFALSIISFRNDWIAGVVLFGSIVLHFVFDIVDDLWCLGHVNPNWKRFRRKRSETSQLALTELFKGKK